MPSFSAGVCEVNRFHCLYPTFLAFLIQALDQEIAVASDSSLDVALFRQLLAFFVPAWNVVLLIATGTDCSAAFLACCRIPYKRCPSLVLSNAGGV